MANSAKSSIIAVGIGKIYTATKSTTPLAATWVESFQSIKDTFKMTQETATVTEIYVDQSDLPIYSVSKAGKLSATFQIPNTATAMLNTFFNTVSETATVAAPVTGSTWGSKSYEAVGMKMSIKDPNIMFRVDIGVGDQIMIFYNLNVSKALIPPTSTTAGAIEITFDVLANPDPAKSDFLILNAVTVG
jgi:hypothetical protein